MIMKLLELRTLLLKAYQKTRFIVNPLVRFFLAFFVFRGINGTIGYDTRITGTLVVLLLSAVCAVTPPGMIVFLAMVVSIVHIFKVSILVAALLLILYIVLYAMLMRFSPRQAIVTVLIPLLAGKNLHYCVPLVLGCVATPVSALPCACGLVIYYMLNIVKAAAARQVTFNLDDMLQLYIDIVDATKANKQMFVAVVVFTLVIVIVFIIRQFDFEYALIISIGAGVVTNILGFLIADLKYANTVNIVVLILMSIVAGLIAYIVEFMKRVLDYTAIERVQFEDDDYYYYVKAVPKVNVSIPRHNVKRMVEGETGDDEEEEEEYSDIHIVGNEDVRYEDYTEEDYNIDTDTSTDDKAADRSFPGLKGRYAFDESAYSRRRGTIMDMPDPADTEEEMLVPDDDGEEEDDADVKYVDYEDDDFN